MNTRSSSNADSLRSEVYYLADALLSDVITTEEAERLQTIVSEDSEARRHYIRFMHDASTLCQWGQDSADADKHPPLAIPTLPAAHYPLPTNFVGGPVFSYMVATVVLCLMLFGAWAYKISHDRDLNVANNSRRSTTTGQPELVFVGHITGMKDCRWSDLETQTYLGASASLGREYALASGLLEITYKTGAKVILEGPCTYKVASSAGGSLAYGKLTARIIHQGPAASAAEAKPRTANPKSQIPNQQIPRFTVRTPTAVVTDLGTEFGVEVSEEGNTTSHVFCGSVKVHVVGGDGKQKDVVLRENESVQVIKVDGNPSITRRAAAEASGFVREMPPPRSVRESRAYAELVLSLNPTVYYRMERPNNEQDRRVVFDSAPGGHHGELYLGNEFGDSPYLSGRFGDSLNFRGPAMGDHVLVPNYPKAADSRLTISAWVMATGRANLATIAVCRGHSHTGRFLVRFVGLTGRSGDLFALVGHEELPTLLEQHKKQVDFIREGASHPFPLFVWQHVAMVADGAILHLYRNGEEVDSCPCADVPQLPLASLGIGCMTNKKGTRPYINVPRPHRQPREYFWRGRIDELAVFDHAFSAEEIRRLYLGQSSGGAGVSPVREVGRDTVGSIGETPLPPTRKEAHLLEQ